MVNGAVPLTAVAGKWHSRFDQGMRDHVAPFRRRPPERAPVRVAPPCCTGVFGSPAACLPPPAECNWGAGRGASPGLLPYSCGSPSGKAPMRQPVAWVGHEVRVLLPGGHCARPKHDRLGTPDRIAGWARWRPREGWIHRACGMQIARIAESWASNRVAPRCTTDRQVPPELPEHAESDQQGNGPIVRIAPPASRRIRPTDETGREQQSRPEPG